MINQTYYIYLHHRLDTGEVFYVGKGTRTNNKQYGRAYSRHTRSKLWTSVAAKAGYSVAIIADFFDEADAFCLERQLISQHGRRHLVAGPLVNMTDGGEGMSGHVPSAQTKAKRRSSMIGRILSQITRDRISASLRGEKHPLFGKTRSAETRRRQAASGKGIRLGGKSPLAKAVIDKVTGAVFPSTRDAAVHFDINRSTLAHKLCGQRRNDTMMEYA